jgi:hypothetical protein
MYTVTMNDASAANADSDSSSTILGFPYGENNVKYNLPKGNAAFDVVTTGFNQADATIKIQQSVDGTNWVDVENGSISLGSGANNYAMVITNVCHKYFRTVFAHGTNSAGTITSKLTFN